MRRLLAVLVLTTLLWLGNAGDANACRFSWCGFGCGPCYSYCCPPCCSFSCGPCWYPCCSYCYTPCYSYSYYPAFYPYQSYGYVSYAAPAYRYAVVPDPAVIVAPANGSSRLVEPPGPAPAPTPSLPSPKPAAPEGEVVVPANRGKVIVSLPADAKLSVDGRTLKTPEGRREFVTPKLENGTTYRYTFKAEVVRNNRLVTQMREVRVRAGEATRVSFDLPGSGTATASR